MVYLCFCPEPPPPSYLTRISTNTSLFSQRGSRNSATSQAGSSSRDRCFMNPEKLDHLFQLLARTYTHPPQRASHTRGGNRLIY